MSLCTKLQPQLNLKCRQCAPIHRHQLRVPRCSATAQASTGNGTAALPALVPLDGNYENAHAFTEYANWLVPGHVLLGRYPFVEPSRCTKRSDGEAQLSKILEAGVTTFVSLQDELPAQNEMRIAGVNGFLPYKATAELIQAALNGPPPLEMVDGLRNPTLDKFLPPRVKKSHGPEDAWMEGPRPRKGPLQFLQSPIVDLGVPSQQQVTELVVDLERRLNAGEVLYVHCWGGRGRAGLLGACMLATLYNLTAEESLVRVQRAFDTRCDGGRKSPETKEQFEFVKNYVQSLA